MDSYQGDIQPNHTEITRVHVVLYENMDVRIAWLVWEHQNHVYTLLYSK